MGITASVMMCCRKSSTRACPFAAVGDAKQIDPGKHNEQKNFGAVHECGRNGGHFENSPSTKAISEFDCVETKPNARIHGIDEDGFQIHHLIDTGGFGFVFKATKRTTGRTYAVKVQPMEFMARLTRGGGKRRANRDSLQMEKTVLASCRNHPFIVKLEYAFCTSMYAALVLEYVPGGTLSRLISHSPKMRVPFDVARIYTAEMAVALNFMHEKGIIYRDIKPSNVLVNLDGHIKLTDFGLAGSLIKVKKKTSGDACVIDCQEREPSISSTNRDLRSSEEGSVSSEEPEILEDENGDIQGDLRRVRRRTLCGTAGYRPPEQVGERFVDYADRSGYDERADWFSLGVTVFTMVCGRRPFPSKKEIMLKSGLTSPSRRRSSFESGNELPDAMHRAAIRKAMKDVEFKCLMTEVSYPDFLCEDPELKSFIEHMIERDPNERPRFTEIKAHPWMSNMDFDEKKLKQIPMPDWVKKHAQQESRAKPKQMRRNSTTQNKQNKDLCLSLFIKDICAQMVDICSKEDAENYSSRWLTNPSMKTMGLFRQWNYISDDAIALEINNASQKNGYIFSSSTSNNQKARRATQ